MRRRTCLGPVDLLHIRSDQRKDLPPALRAECLHDALLGDVDDRIEESVDGLLVRHHADGLASCVQGASRPRVRSQQRATPHEDAYFEGNRVLMTRAEATCTVIPMLGEEIVVRHVRRPLSMIEHMFDRRYCYSLGTMTTGLT